MLKTIFMFSGQGSQYYGALKSLFAESRVFKKEMNRLDAIAGDILGESVLDRLYDESRQKELFDRTLYAHPALFMQQYAISQVLLNMGIKPDIVLGVSVGEFLSAAVSGALSVEDAFCAVIRQAEDIERNCSPGRMLAILDNCKLYDSNQILHENSTLAGVFCDSHFVVSGTEKGLGRITSFLKRENIDFMALPVLHGFHSALIDPAQASFMAFCKDLSCYPPEIPFISCIEAEPISALPVEHFWKIAREPIFFMKTIFNLERKESYIYLDLGPSGTLSNFVLRNLGGFSKSLCMALATPFGNEKSLLKKAQKVFSNKSYKPYKGGGTMKTFVFPGQGSQKKGMGKSLFDKFEEISKTADKVMDCDMKELCLKNPEGRLTKTQYTQPVLYLVNALYWLQKTSDKNEIPDFLAGHSLGEYNALFASGVFDFETGLKLVKERGRLMAQAKDGGMAAVIGLDEDKIKEIIGKNAFKNLHIANYNSPEQIVISGAKKDVEKAQKSFQKEGVKLFMPLKVGGAFHSPYMQAAADEFADFIRDFSFASPGIPVVSNVTARPYRKDEIKKLLIAQILSPVRWTDSIRYLLGQGDMEFDEIGPGKVLTGLIRKIREASIVEQKPEAMEQVPVSKKMAKVVEQAPEGDDPGSGICAKSLGSTGFKEAYGLEYAYVTGGMVRGIASTELVTSMGKAGMMGFFGTGGLDSAAVEQAILDIQKGLGERPFGMNFLHHPEEPYYEEGLTDIFLKHKVPNIEAAAFMQMTPALVRYRLAGLFKDKDGSVAVSNKVMGKISRPEVAEAFLRPAPERIVKSLLESGGITEKQAELAAKVPMADAICAEADSGGHTDMAQAFAIFPAIEALRDRITKEQNYKKKIFLGSAGGIGTPEAAAAAFILGADFILTGSINQCTIEAGTSDMAKNMLSQMNVQDTDYCPAGDMFEMGAKVQVLRSGVFFPARANKLHDLYKQYDSIDEIDEKTKGQIQKLYFKKSFDEVYEETKAFFTKRGQPEQIEKAEKNPKHKMALLFRWYFGYSANAAMEGCEEDKVNFQIHTGPALGAFNQWVKGTELEDRRNRHVDKIGVKLMEGTAGLLKRRFEKLFRD